MTYDSWHLTRIVGWGYIQGTKCSEKKILKIHFPELVQIFAFQKLVLNNWRILSWKKWWVPTIFYNKSLFQPLGSCTLRYSVRHLQVFTELFHLAMKSPVDPTAGTFFEKKNHGPFCVWIQTTNLYPQNKTKIFWQTFKKKIESLYKNYTFMEKMSKHHHFPKNNFRKTPSFQTPYLGRRILDRHGWRFQALLNEALYCCKRFSR